MFDLIIYTEYKIWMSLNLTLLVLSFRMFGVGVASQIATVLQQYSSTGDD